MNIQSLNFDDIVRIPLKRMQYYREVFAKKQIVLHHTVSNDTVENIVHGWNSNIERVGAAFIIDRQGVLYQTFSSAHWAHHLGTQLPNNRELNQRSIAIELCSWGGLKERRGQFTNLYKNIIPDDEVVDYGIEKRGYRYFHKYTEAQLQTLQILLNYLCTKYNIPKTYNPMIWDYNLQAISGSPGIYTHRSYRMDKSDCHPQLELIKALNSL